MQSASRAVVDHTSRSMGLRRVKGEEWWSFHGDSALPLENSRKCQVCPCKQPFLCHGCVFIGQCLESLPLPLRFACPDVSHLLDTHGVGGRMSFQPPPSASHTFPGLRGSLLYVKWPPSPVFLPPIERRLKLSDTKIQLTLLGEVRGRFQPESAKGCQVEQRTACQRNLDLHSSLDAMSCMTLGKSPHLPKTQFIVWRMGTMSPALLTSPG